MDRRSVGKHGGQLLWTGGFYDADTDADAMLMLMPCGPEHRAESHQRAECVTLSRQMSVAGFKVARLGNTVAVGAAQSRPVKPSRIEIFLSWLSTRRDRKLARPSGVADSAKPLRATTSNAGTEGPAKDLHPPRPSQLGSPFALCSVAPFSAISFSWRRSLTPFSSPGLAEDDCSKRCIYRGLQALSLPLPSALQGSWPEATRAVGISSASATLQQHRTPWAPRISTAVLTDPRGRSPSTDESPVSSSRQLPVGRFGPLELGSHGHQWWLCRPAGPVGRVGAAPLVWSAALKEEAL
ncbi:hypothetical protein FALBO_4339 [Fusarium albosuccineum]|uniref:Uncharacterized protein n=1 Tax=Fusarium albosuccineum TaxID=1237068 RepID=A0A8H4LI44_9HYPO|nr:hypothetical protein FALBO_4339 [Fusarium albosuccineum]